MTTRHTKSMSSSSDRLADPDAVHANCGVGMVMDLDGGRSHEILSDGLRLLENLEHRGTTGAEESTGDGAGVLLQRPDTFFADIIDRELPDMYAVGMIFFPQEESARQAIEEEVEQIVSSHGLQVFNWRTVPTDNSTLGDTAKEAEPVVRQCFIRPKQEVKNQELPAYEAFDKALYVARRDIENNVEEKQLEGHERFYVCSLDRETIVYKGLLKSTQLTEYYQDLSDTRLQTTFALVHARFSTNTLGAWHLAHPYRRIIHNGEFNTIQGNINWMRSRETDLDVPTFDEEETETIKPVIDDPGQSDTASVDNVIELLLKSGRSLPHALRMLVPEAWRGSELMDEDRKDWYDYHASLIEPWDGPALVCGTDGDRVGAILDRNGLRPCRYDITTDDRVIMASEAGALEPDYGEIKERDRLQPGQLFLADPEEGRVIPDEEVFEELIDPKYKEWVESQQVTLADANGKAGKEIGDIESLRSRQATFGYSHDELENLIEPMIETGKDPVGSMGDDTPLSVLSEYNRPLSSYFKQLFAQVTNPPIDYLREECVTSLETRLGSQRNLLEESPEHANQLVLESPILTNDELATIKDVQQNGLKSKTVDITFDRETDMKTAVERVRAKTKSAIQEGNDIVVLSDRKMDADRLPIPALLVTGAVHHYLVRQGLRNDAGIVLESGDPRTVHQFSTLIGYGAGAINPYLAFDTLADLSKDRSEASIEQAAKNYVKAIEKGILKTMSKMGISTVESYRGAQIFEAVGLDSDFVAEYFEGTTARTGGIGIEEIERDLWDRHNQGWNKAEIDRYGEFEFRSGGIHHQWNPQTVGALQRAVRNGDYETYKEFASDINEQEDTLQTLRGLLEFNTDERESVPVEEVEPVEDIVTRFSTAAMSLGSISPEAHENNSIAMNRIGGKSNTGEGGEQQERFGTEKECNVKQVASGRFGVTAKYLSSAEELQIKMAQGSKPGEGGHLPGEKVNQMIAEVRHSTEGVSLISPPPLHDIYSIEDLKQLIHDLKAANPDADINVKLVSEDGIGTIAAGVAKANADVVHISGHSGGTGASPRTSIKNAGLPWELGLAEAQQMLVETELRDRIKVAVDGGLKTGRDVAIAALLGAEEYVFGTASLVTSGCVMARQCHENTCPTGVATQREDLRRRFPGEPDNVINYMTFIAEELREIMADLGFRSVDEMIGKVDLLAQRDNIDHPKAENVDLSAVLAEPNGSQRRKIREQSHEIDGQLDYELIEQATPAIEEQTPVSIEAQVTNQNRTIGATLSNKITNEHGAEGLQEDAISISTEGTAGQSFGAFLTSGVAIHHTGSANDYVGKGLSGGKISVTTPPETPYDPAENTAIGNVALYGATSGEMYINGRAGERFAVRNSGTKAVVEGVGDHGCEYMTGGVVAILGDTGRNFAAGMSGGIAYVHDPEKTFKQKVNREMVTVKTELSERDQRMLHRLVENHAGYTGSEKAETILNNWESAIEDFVVVIPEAYQRVLAERDVTDVREQLPSSVSTSNNSSPAPADD